MAETRGNGEKMKEKYGLRFKNQFPVKQRGGALKGVGEVCSVRFGSFCAYKPGLLTSKKARVFLDKGGVTGACKASRARWREGWAWMWPEH